MGICTLAILRQRVSDICLGWVWAQSAAAGLASGRAGPNLGHNSTSSGLDWTDGEPEDGPAELIELSDAQPSQSQVCCYSRPIVATVVCLYMCAKGIQARKEVCVCVPSNVVKQVLGIARLLPAYGGSMMLPASRTLCCRPRRCSGQGSPPLRLPSLPRISRPLKGRHSRPSRQVSAGCLPASILDKQEAAFAVHRASNHLKSAVLHRIQDSHECLSKTLPDFPLVILHNQRRR